MEGRAEGMRVEFDCEETDWKTIKTWIGRKLPESISKVQDS